MTPSFPILSLEDANALIPELESCLDRLTTHKEACDRRHDQLFFRELLEHAEHRAGRAVDPTALEDECLALESLTQGMEQEVQKIRELGGLVRDLNEGWVDFLGLWQKKIVFFCWKKGQKRIDYFHPLRSPANARFPIPTSHRPA